jgi:hypothetical protein
MALMMMISSITSASSPTKSASKTFEKLQLFCLACGVEGEFPGVFHTQDIVAGSQTLVSARMPIPNATPMSLGPG